MKTLFDTTHELSAGAGQHPATAVLGRNQLREHQLINNGLGNAAIDAVTDDQQRVHLVFGQGFGHESMLLSDVGVYEEADNKDVSKLLQVDMDRKIEKKLELHGRTFLVNNNHDSAVTTSIHTHGVFQKL